MTHNQKITIINRNGDKVDLNFNKILNRLNSLIDMNPKLSINADYIAKQTINQMGNVMTTSEIDELAANICSSLIVEHIDYDMLASRILVNNLHKQTRNCIKLYCDDINNYYCNEIHNPLLSDKVIKFINYNQDFLNLIIDHTQDYTYEYFGIMTLLKSYLLKHNVNGKFIIKERPQQMIIRVVIGLNLNYINDDGSTTWEILKEIKTTYKIMSERCYTHATPTLFNSGTRWNNLSSCFLLEVGDSMDSIKKSWSDCADISRYSGGIGLNITKIRAKNSIIRSTNGTSDGLVPMLKTFDSIVSYVSQGGGKRKGSSAVYIEPWHADVIGVLNTAQQHGPEESLCRNLFIAIWMNDIFMQRLEESLNTKTTVMWSLFCPDKATKLIDAYGDDFNENYKKYEEKKLYNEQIPVLDIWKLIVKLQVEKGMPYILYKDAVNKKTNQNNLGTINSSNLCVSGDTYILIDLGYYKIKDLDGQLVNIWNGREFSKSYVSKTGVNQKMLEIKTNDGCVLKCTPYHKFHLDGNIIKDAKDLQPEDKLIKYKFPTIQTNLDRKLKWISELIDAHGCIIGNCLQIIAYTNDQIKNLNSIKLVSNTMGCNPKIIQGKLIFNTFDTYHLFKELNLQTKVVLYENTVIPNKNNQLFIRIESITVLDKKEDTYCFNEPKRHMGIFNGILTGNCAEILLYTSPEQIGVCNLASICLPKFINNNVFDYNKLYEITKVITYNMNKVIDHNLYVLKECKHSDDLHRPIGIGIQGLASAFMQLKLPFTSDEAKRINKNIFETIYFAALEASMELAQKHGPYKSYETSMMAEGKLQFDLWNVVPDSGLWDWDQLRQKIKNHGIYNSLLLALMPTASTANINGNTEAFEPITSNMYTRSTLSGKFQIINKYLIRDLIEQNLWNDNMMNKIIAYEGSIQNIDEIPQKLKDIYKTVYEYQLKNLIDMDADRNAYVCQTSSSNRFMLDPTFNKLTKMHLYCWKKGLKTGSYYIRTKASIEGNKMTADVKIIKEIQEKKRKSEEDNDVDKAIANKKNKVECTEDVCTMCSA